MSRLGAAGAVAQLVADVPLSFVEGDGVEQLAWEKWSNDGTEQLKAADGSPITEKDEMII